MIISALLSMRRGQGIVRDAIERSHLKEILRLEEINVVDLVGERMRGDKESRVLGALCIPHAKDPEAYLRLDCLAFTSESGNFPDLLSAPVPRSTVRLSLSGLYPGFQVRVGSLIIGLTSGGLATLGIQNTRFSILYPSKTITRSSF